MSLPRLIVGGLTALAITVLIAQAARLSSANDMLRSSQAGLITAQAAVQELTSLRNQAKVRIFGEPPAEEFIGAVNSTLVQAGLDTSLARSITNEAARIDTEGTTGTKEMRIDFQPVTIAQLGSILAGWDADQPAWKVSSININKLSGRQTSADAYRVLLTCSAEYAVTERP